MTPDEVLDTPAGLLDKMMEAENAFNSFREFNNLSPSSVTGWINANPDKWKIISRLSDW